MQHLLFVRHGETEGNLTEIAHGQTESPLTERGIAQAKVTALHLKSWTRVYHRIYTSTLSRAFHTGSHIAEALALPIDMADDLKEGNLGDWEGITYRQLHENKFAPHSIADDNFRGHNGESPNQLGERVAGAVHRIRSQHPGENIIFVSHGAAIAHLVARLLNTRPAFGHQYLMHNTGITEICIAENKAELLTLNYFDHLPEALKAAPPVPKTKSESGKGK